MQMTNAHFLQMWFKYYLQYVLAMSHHFPIVDMQRAGKIQSHHVTALSDKRWGEGGGVPVPVTQRNMHFMCRQKERKLLGYMCEWAQQAVNVILKLWD